MVGLSTYFDECSVDYREGFSQQISSCINFMGQTDTHVLFENKIAVCEYHHCVIPINGATNRHNILSCSGGILNFGEGLFLNPVTPFIMDFDSMVRLPPSAVDLMAGNLQYYYAKDIRTAFEHDIVDINCTNDFKTCLTFANTSTCFGNVDDVNVHHSEEMLVWGVINSLFIGSFVVFVLFNRFKSWTLWHFIAAYLCPVVAMVSMYAGIFLAPLIPFVMMNLIVFALFPIVHYTMRDVVKDSSSP